MDYHHGMVSASNIKDPQGVEFTVVLPLKFDGKKSGIFGVP